MNGNDFRDLDEKHLEAWQQRVDLVETLLDERIHESERAEIRRSYIRTHGVSERTIRNYLRRYREHGAEGLLFHRTRGSDRSPRVHDEPLQQKILTLIEEHPRRTVPQLRRILKPGPRVCTGDKPHIGSLDLPLPRRAWTDPTPTRGQGNRPRQTIVPAVRSVRIDGAGTKRRSRRYLAA